MNQIKSPYERQLKAEFEAALLAHLARPDIEKKLKRTGNVDREIRRFAKRYDLKYKTEFYDILKEGN